MKGKHLFGINCVYNFTVILCVMNTVINIVTVSMLLANQVVVTDAALATTWHSCQCRWDDWKAWSNCDSKCFGNRQRERSVWTICDKFTDCATNDEGFDNQKCNEVCHNGGMATGSFWRPCKCKPGFYSSCCTNRVNCGDPGSISDGEVSVSSEYYGGIATYSCHNHYNMSGGEKVRQCQNNFAWSGSEPKCIFANHCESTPCKNGATCVNLLGDFHCECANGWTGQFCENDIQPPLMTDCSEEIYIYAADSEVQTNWTRPKFIDPMGSKLDIVSNYPTPEFTFPWGDHTVQYVATKTSNGLVTECSFQIKIRPNPCDDLNVPTNGALLCNGWKREYGQFCMITCHQNYTLLPAKSYYTWYVCGASGKWIAAGPVPDCEVQVDSNKEAEYFQPEYSGYTFSSTCEDGTTRESLQNLYIEQLKRAEGFSSFCSNNAECVKENVNVKCGSSSAT